MTNRDTRAADVRIEPDAIRRYCDIVFGYLDGFVPIRVFAEKGTPHQKPWTPFCPIAEAADRLIFIAQRAMESQRGVYIVPGTVEQTTNARSEDIRQTGVLLVDLDDGDISTKREDLARHLGKPTLVVASGGITSEGHAKLHLYWRLSEAATGEDLRQVSELRASIAAKVGGDMSFGSLHQPVRVPGTIHAKHGRRAAVRILEHDVTEYDLGDLAERVSEMPPVAGLEQHAQRRENAGPTARDLSSLRVRENGEDGITRFDALSRVIGHWLRTARRGGCTLEEAWDAVRDHNLACIVPPWDEPRLRREFDALLRKDVAGKGPIEVGQPSLPSADAPPEFSDDALAAAFVEAHGKDWRHVAVWGRWYGWTGVVWRQDETHRVRDVVRNVCRQAANNAGSESLARRLASDKTISAVVRIAAADPAIAVAPAAWDAHPMLLNTPRGVLDLETGEVLAHDRDLLLSQITTASPGGDCRRWRMFLHEITDGDLELQKYLARFAGYCLTGSTREEMFAFLHGAGGNGKSKFVETIAAVLGDYAATATSDTFVASRGTHHLTELAGLRAARLVRASETEDGRAWNEQRIKVVTGGERIRANFMRQDHFEFTPQFKLLVSGNHRPALTSVGEAMRRRLHLIPFDVTFPPERRDLELPERLLAERDGILGWMLEGCAKWQRVGLSPPARVRDATADYFETEDLIGQWIADQCQTGPEHVARSSDLYQSWKSWAEQNGFLPGSAKSLGAALRSRGFADCTVRRARGRRGLSLTNARPIAEAAE